jgi:hypothetical protein
MGVEIASSPSGACNDSKNQVSLILATERIESKNFIG